MPLHHGYAHTQADWLMTQILRESISTIDLVRLEFQFSSKLNSAFLPYTICKGSIKVIEIQCVIITLPGIFTGINEVSTFDWLKQLAINHNFNFLFLYIRILVDFILPHSNRSRFLPTSPS